MKQIILWRHGQTDWNLANRFQGHSDIPLNSVGLYQVKQAAKVLRDLEPTKIISSDLSRALTTASALGEVTGLEVIIDKRLRETDGGKWEGKTGAENRERDFERFVRWIDGADEPAGETGERRSEVAARASESVFSHLNELEIDERLVVVTHGGTARCLLGHMLNLPLSLWGKFGGLSNASWSVLEENRHWRNEAHSARDLIWLLAEHNAFTIPEPVLGDESGSNEFI
jgi:broad specificity phosphatase PhoE